MDLKLKDKTVRWSPAPKVGIGRAIAKALAAEGVRLAVSARRVDKLEELAAEIVAAGGQAPVLVACDPYEAATRQPLAAAAVAAPPVDILVNNAGWLAQLHELHERRRLARGHHAQLPTARASSRTRAD